MRITVRLFAALRERVGVDEMVFELTSGNSVADLIQGLIVGENTWQALTQEQVLVAVNQTMAEQSTLLADGDEVAFFPPVTGG